MLRPTSTETLRAGEAGSEDAWGVIRHQPPDWGVALIEHSPEHEGDRYAAVKQYSLARILAVWAAAALPMGVLAWVVAPWLEDQLGGDEPLLKSLLLLLTAGLIWQFVLVVILIQRELGTLRWSRVREALWLRPPRDPRTGRVGGRVWLWVLPFIVLFAIEGAIPGLTGSASRDFAEFLADSDRAEEFFRGEWGWFAVIVVLVVFNTVLGEELLWRGLLLPRMRGVFGRGDFVANGVLFALYHLHTPWVIPTTLIDIFALAYPTRRFQSAWMGIVVHSTQSVFVIIIILALVLG